MGTQAEQLAKLQTWLADIRGTEDQGGEVISPAVSALGRLSPATSLERALHVESISLRRLRPVLTIKDGTTELEFSDAQDGVVWRQKLIDAEEVLKKAIGAVGRIGLKNAALDWIGTGWLVSDTIIVTNRHVAEAFAERRGQDWDFIVGPRGAVRADIDFLQEHRNRKTLTFRLKRPLAIEHSDGPDIAFFEVDLTSGDGKLARHIELDEAPAPSNAIAVIGYPAFDSRVPEPELMDRIFGSLYDKKRLAPGAATEIDDQILTHNCSTLGGCSGSPVMSLDTGKAIGLHFSGTFLTANYAVRSDIVAAALSRAKSGVIRPMPLTPSAEQSTVQVRINGGETTVSIPLTITVTVGTPEVNGPSSSMVLSPEPARDFVMEEEGRPEEYEDREGYDPAFLGDGKHVNLPEVVRDTSEVLEFTRNGAMDTELRYRHFSVVMSAPRRMCFLSAVNIDGEQSKRSKRPAWRWDPRIPKEFQIMNECYGDPPRFSRGHMTRREDPAWGDDAGTGNKDSMHVTNAVPQMQAFNSPIWLELEDYALQNAREDDMKISVFTGPFFKSSDPIMYGVKIPISFWKVIAFVHDETGKLCATGYKMSQRSSVPSTEFIFSDFQSQYLNVSAQVAISAIEAEAGISFGSLKKFDPLNSVVESHFVEKALTRLEQIRFT